MELSDHVIDNIETTVPKLQSLMEKRLNTASELITRLNREIAMAENAARNTTICAIEYVQECFVKIRRYLDETEEEIKQGARKYFDDFMQFNEDRVEFMNAVRKLRALSEEGKLYNTYKMYHLKGVVSRNSAKLGYYKMLVKLIRLKLQIA